MQNQVNTNVSDDSQLDMIPHKIGIIADPQDDSQAGYELIFTDTANNVENRFPVEDNQEIHVGAGYENDVLLADDAFISGKHFTVQRNGDKFFVSDLQSRNGLFIQVGAMAVEVEPGQVILAGKTRFRIEQVQQA